MTAIALQHRDEIIERIANGDILRNIAEDLCIRKQSISEVLHNDPEYQAAISTRWHTQLDDELEAMREAVGARDPDAVRAREAVLRRVEWRAERECPALWGPRSTVSVEHSSPDAAQILGAAADLVRALERRRERVIPGGIVADAPQLEPPAE